MVFSGSFVQPAYGFLSDRFHSRMFSVLAPAMAGDFYFAAWACRGISRVRRHWYFWAARYRGVPSAGFGLGDLGISSNRGQWMAVFISAGTLGLAIGPTYFASVFQWVGSGRSYLAAIPA